MSHNNHLVSEYTSHVPFINKLTTYEGVLTFVWNENNEIIYIAPHTYENCHVEHSIGDCWMNIFPDNIVSDIVEHFKEQSDPIKLSKFYLNGYVFNAVIESLFIDGEVLYIAKIYNITHKHELEKVIIDSHKLAMTGKLAAGFIHEIRNPLTSIKGFIQLIQAGIKQKEQYYKVMINQIEKIERITNQLLASGRPETELYGNENVQDIINDVVYLFKVNSDMQNINYTLEWTEDVSIYCNSEQIQQVIFNVLLNAIEAMDFAGNIKIKNYIENNMCVLHVEDDGPGIPQHILKDLSKPFFTTKKSGTGLGLMICKQIVEQHNGELIIKNNVDYGAIIKIMLPMNLEQ